MIKYFLLPLLCLSFSLNAQTRIAEGTVSVSKTTGGITTTNVPTNGQVLFTDGTIYYWAYSTNAPATNVVLSGQVIKSAGSTTTVIATGIIGTTNIANGQITAALMANDLDTNVFSSGGIAHLLQLVVNTFTLTNTFIAAGANVTITTNVVGGKTTYTIASTGGGAGVFVTPTNGVTMTTNANVVTVGTALAQGSNITLSTNGSGVITITASGGAGSGFPLSANGNAAGFAITNLGYISFSSGSTITNTISDTNAISMVNASGQYVFQINTNGITFIGTNNQFKVDASGNGIFLGTISGTGLNLSGLTATSIVGTDGSKNLKSVLLSGLTYDGTTLTATASGSQTPLTADVNGALFGITNLSQLRVGTNANIGLWVVNGFGNATLYTTNGILYYAYDQNTNIFFSLAGTNQQITFRGLIQIPTNGLAIGGITDPGAGNLNASNNIKGLSATISGLNVIGIVTNNATGDLKTTPTLPNTLLANSTIGVAGTANQITSSTTTPALGGSTTLAIANPLTTPGNVTITGTATVTGLNTIGVVTNDGSGVLKTTPTLPTSLMGGNGVFYCASSGPITVPISGTYFFHPNNSFTNFVADTVGITQVVMPFPGKVLSVYAVTDANPGAVNNVVTVRTNAVDTGVTCTLNNVTSANDTAHPTIPFLAGTTLSIKLVTGAGTAVHWTIGVVCEASSGF